MTIPPTTTQPTTAHKPALPLPSTEIERASIIAPLLFLVGQLIVLAIGTARVELTARSGDLPQRLALPEMIAFQFAISALCFSTVLNSVTIVGSAIFIDLAASLGQTNSGQTCWTIFLVGSWLCALELLSRALHKTAAQPIVGALLVTAVIGLPIAEYLVTEFSDARIGWLDPISITIRQSMGDSLFAGAIVLSAASNLLVIFFALRLHQLKRS